MRPAKLVLLAIIAAPLWAQPAPPDTLDLFVIAGQSNATGAGGDAALAPVPDRRTVYWVINRQGAPSLVPAGVPQHLWNGTLGPAFGQRYHELTGRPVALLQVGHRGTTVVADAERGNGHWSATHVGPGPRGGPDRLSEALAVVDSVRALRVGGSVLRPSGVIWVQGESDAVAVVRGLTTGPEFRAELELTTAALRDAIGTGGDAGPLYLVQSGRPLSRDSRGHRAIRTAQADGALRGWYDLVCQDALSFPALGWMADDVHWAQPALDHVGEHVAEAAALDAPPPYEPEDPRATQAEDGPLTAGALPYPNPVRPGQAVRGLEPGSVVVDALGRVVGRADVYGVAAAPLAPGVYATADGARFTVRPQ